MFTSYTRLNTISSGTYGTVHRARCNLTGSVVALKKVRLEDAGGFPVTALREVNVLFSARHENVVGVREVVVGRANDSVYVVMVYAEHELKVLLQRPTPPFRLPALKRLFHQLLSALAYLHARFVLHRDVKTSNLLYGNDGRLLLADFGLARPYGLPLQPYTPTVVTLWYRAPELLLGAQLYGPAVDAWSAGCVLAEMLRAGRPLWPGRGELDQLSRVWETMGGMSEEEVREVVGERPGGGAPGWRVKPGDGVCRLRSLFSERVWEEGGLSESGYALLRGLLELNPKKRWTAAEALKSAWFTEEPRMEREDRMPTFASSNESSDRKEAVEADEAKRERRERETRFHVA